MLNEKASHIENDVKEETQRESDAAARAGLYTEHEAEASPESTVGARANHLKLVKEEPVWEIELVTRPDEYVKHEVKEPESEPGSQAGHIEHEVKEEPVETEATARVGLCNDHEAEDLPEGNVASHLMLVKEEPVWHIELATQPDKYMEHEVKEPDSEAGLQAGHIEHEVKKQPQWERDSTARAGLCTDHEADDVPEINVPSHLMIVKEEPVWDIELATQPDKYMEHEVKEPDSEAGLQAGHIEHEVKKQPQWERDSTARAGLCTDHEADDVPEINVPSHLMIVKEEPVWDIELATQPDKYMEHEVKEPDSEAGSQAGHIEHEVKEESVDTEEAACGVSAAAMAGLYPDHTVKEELVVGPEEMHRPKVTLVHPGPSQQEYRRKQQETKTSMNDKPYKCNHCSYASIQKSHLKRHEKTHTGEKPYKCAHCSYSSAYRSHLEGHTRTHTGEKPYKCAHCSYSSAHERVLKCHEKTHTGEKPYKCAQCSYSSADKSHLRRHIKTHTGEKPHKCAHCTYSSTERRHLENHIKTHTGENPYKCAQCSFSSAYMNSLKVHIRRNHKNVHTVVTLGN